MSSRIKIEFSSFNRFQRFYAVSCLDSVKTRFFEQATHNRSVHIFVVNDKNESLTIARRVLRLASWIIGDRHFKMVAELWREKKILRLLKGGDLEGEDLEGIH